MRRFLRENGLSVAMFTVFALTLLGLTFSGWYDHNEEQRLLDEPEVSYGDYLFTPDFGEAVFENWESEFLQMGAYVLLTVFLFQRGSSESKKLDEEAAVDEDPELRAPGRTPPHGRSAAAAWS